MKKSTKILIAVLVIALCLGALTVAVLAAGASEGKQARIGITYYDHLIDAVRAANASDKEERIELLSDVTLAGLLPFEKSMLLDLNGHKITGPENNYMFKLEAAGITIKLVGEGTIFANNNGGNGILNIAELASGSEYGSFALEGHFDGITLMGYRSKYFNLNRGTLSFNNVTTYSPETELIDGGADDNTHLDDNRKDKEITALVEIRGGVFNADKWVHSKYYDETKSNVYYYYNSVLSVYDSTTVVLNNSYIQSASSGIFVNKDTNTTKENQNHQYLTVNSSVINATHIKTEDKYLWLADTNGWKIFSGDFSSCRAVFVNATGAANNPIGKIAFTDSELYAGWRTFVANPSATLMTDGIVNTVTYTNCIIEANTNYGGQWTQEQLDRRKELDKAAGNSAYTAYPTVGKNICKAESLWVRGSSARHYYFGCKMYSTSGGSFWAATGDKTHDKKHPQYEGDERDDESSGGIIALDYFFLDKACRFNSAITDDTTTALNTSGNPIPKGKAVLSTGGNNNATMIGVGTLKNITAWAKVEYNDPKYPYMPVATGPSNIDATIKFRDGTTASASDGTTYSEDNKNKSAIQHSTVSGGLDGDGYYKIFTNNNVAKYNANFASGGKGYGGNSNTFTLGHNSYFLLYGSQNNAGTHSDFKVFDGTTPLYRYFTYGVSFKTDDNFFYSNTAANEEKATFNISSRWVNSSNSLAGGKDVINFKMHTDGKIYLQRSGYSDYNSKACLDKGADQWYRLEVVFDLEANVAYYFLDGSYIGNIKDAVNTSAVAFDAIRINFNNGSDVHKNESICVDNFYTTTSDAFPTYFETEGSTEADDERITAANNKSSGSYGTYNYKKADGNHQSVYTYSTATGVRSYAESPNRSPFTYEMTADNGVKVGLSKPTTLTAAQDTLYGVGVHADNWQEQTDTATVKINTKNASYWTFANNSTSSDAIRLYDSATSGRKYDFISASINVRTDEIYLQGESDFTLRFAYNSSGSIITGTKVAVYFATSGKDTYLRTPAQRAAKSGGVKLSNIGWHKISIVVAFADNAAESTAYYYLDGKLIGKTENCFVNNTIDTDKNTLEKQTPMYYTNGRFNMANGTYYKNATTYLRDYKCYVGNMPENNADSNQQPYDYYGKKLYMNDYTVADNSSAGVVAGYITSPVNGEPLYGTYYSDLTAALAAQGGKYVNYKLLKSVSGININAPASVVTSGSATLTDYTFASTLGHIKDGNKYKFSDTFTSLVAIAKKDTADGAYGTHGEFSEMLIGQPLPTRADLLTGGGIDKYKVVGYRQNPDSGEIITLVPEQDSILYEAYKKNSFIIYQVDVGSGDSTPVDYGFSAEDIAAKLPLMDNYRILTMREDVTYSGSELQFRVAEGKVTAFDLAGFDFIVDRGTSGEIEKHLFIFTNTDASGAADFTLASTVPGGELYLSSANRVSRGSVFMVPDNAEGNKITIDGGAGTLTVGATAILDARGANTAFRARDINLVRADEGYASFLSIRPNSANTTVEIERTNIISALDTNAVSPIFSVLSPTAVVGVRDSGMYNLSTAGSAYLVYNEAKTYKPITVDADGKLTQQSALAEGGADKTFSFSGTVQIENITSNIILDMNTRAAATGSVRMQNIRQAAAALKGTGADEYIYFVTDNTAIVYPNGSAADSEFYKISESLSESFSYYKHATDGTVETVTVPLNITLEAACPDTAHAYAIWSLSGNSALTLAPIADLTDADTLAKYQEAPLTLPSDKAGIYVFKWVNAGTAAPADGLSKTDKYALPLTPYTKITANVTNGFDVSGNISVQDNFTYNLYIPEAVIDEIGYNAVRLGTYNPVSAQYDYVPYILTASDLHTVSGLGECYVVSYKNIKTVNAADSFNIVIDIPVTVDAQTDITYSPSWTFSISNYAKKIINGISYSTESKQMVTDMLAFIKEAYLLSNLYNDVNDALNNSITEAIEYAYDAGFTATAFSADVNALAKAPAEDTVSSLLYGAGISVFDDQSIKYVFMAQKGLNGFFKVSYNSTAGASESVIAKVENGKITEINGAAVERSEQSDSLVLAVKVYDFNTTMSISIYDYNEGVFDEACVTDTAEYNSAEYLRYLIETADYAEALVKALYNFSESAKAYKSAS